MEMSLKNRTLQYVKCFAIIPLLFTFSKMGEMSFHLTGTKLIINGSHTQVEEERFSAVGLHNVLRASNLKISHKNCTKECAA